MDNANDNKPKGHKGDSSEKSKTPEPWQHCYAQLEPAIKDFIHIACTAPIDNQQTMFLLLAIAANTFGAACGSLQACDPALKDVPFSQLANSVLNMLIPVMEQNEAAQRH